MIRVYFNYRNAENGLVWSVDDGDQKNEINLKKLVIRIPMISVFDGTAQKGQPSGWLYSETGTLTIIDDIGTIE